MAGLVTTDFSDEELVLLDALVDAGLGENRSVVIRRGLHHLADGVGRGRVGAAIAASYRDVPQTNDDVSQAMANAISLTEAEPW